MATAKATLSNFRQAPRKMRMVVNAVRGKSVAEALVNLDFIAKKAAQPVKTLIMSAVANAKAQDIPTENLIVKTILVNGGAIMYRRSPASRGMAHPLRKRTSSVYVELGEKEVKSKKTGTKVEVSDSVEEKSKAVVKKPKAKATKAKASTAKTKTTK